MIRKRFVSTLSFICLLIACTTCLLIACDTESRISVEDVWIRPDPMMENAAGYMIIQNTGNTNDALIGVKSEFSSTASVHKTIMEGALHRMEHVPYLEVPAGKTIIFQPLSYHVMLMSLTTPLENSQTVTLMLEFENAGWISVTAEVQLDNN